MSITPIANFLKLQLHNQKTDQTSPVQKWQNASFSNLTGPEGGTFAFAPFIYQGAARTKNGDNIESTIVLPPNRLSMNWAWGTAIATTAQAVAYTCLMDQEFSRILKVITEEVWCITSMGYSESSVEIKLTNVIDAVDSNVPFITLNRKRCGNLPVTANIQNA